MQVTIDEKSGFCFGVINAIRTAEEYLQSHEHLYCLGDIVHNNEEVRRLTNLGLTIITHEEFACLYDVTVLIRAHGEPPETYLTAKKNRIQLVDATCPVVLSLQKMIKKSHEKSKSKGGQILIFGKKGHAEVVGLLGQTPRNGIVLSSIQDINKIDCNKPAVLYSQTTQSIEQYSHLIRSIQQKYEEAKQDASLFEHHDTICRKVANRSEEIKLFAARFDKVIFVSGEKSSNGLYLFEQCKSVNQNTFFISNPGQLEDYLFSPGETVGICGATSTPMWLMQAIRQKIIEKTPSL